MSKFRCTNGYLNPYVNETPDYLILLVSIDIYIVKKSPETVDVVPWCSDYCYCTVSFSKA